MDHTIETPPPLRMYAVSVLYWGETTIRWYDWAVNDWLMSPQQPYTTNQAEAQGLSEVWDSAKLLTVEIPVNIISHEY
jgi:hypothetical protein